MNGHEFGKEAVGLNLRHYVRHLRDQIDEKHENRTRQFPSDIFITKLPNITQKRDNLSQLIRHKEVKIRRSILPLLHTS